VFTYKTGFFSGTYSLGDVVDALKEHMRLDGVMNRRRIVFVCHSMGGIVARRFLVQRAADLIENRKSIGLFLVASPSLGSGYANWLSPLARFFEHTQADALRFEQTNTWLMDLDRDFQNLKESERLSMNGKSWWKTHSWSLATCCAGRSFSRFRARVISARRTKCRTRTTSPSRRWKVRRPCSTECWCSS
jgi:hypothetical protein